MLLSSQNRIVFCVIKIQTGFMLLAPSYAGFVGEKDVKGFFCFFLWCGIFCFIDSWCISDLLFFTFVSLVVSPVYIVDVYLTVVFCLVFPVVLQFHVVGWGKCVQSDLFCVTTETWTQLSFCLAEGYQEAAEHFQNEANIEPDENASTLQERMQIREAVQSGKIENAFQLINSHFPGLLMSNDELHFQLQASVVSYPTATINSSRTKIQLFLLHLAWFQPGVTSPDTRLCHGYIMALASSYPRPSKLYYTTTTTTTV